MKAHQRTIREQKEINPTKDLFNYIPKNLNLKDTVVKRIDFNTAKPIILEYEWIGTMPLPKSCRFIYGIYFEGILGGAVVYVHPSTRQFEELYPRQAVQLNRGACVYWTPKNTASRLISESIHDLRNNDIKIIIAYCTKEAGEYGTIYQALGWWYIGETTPSKVYYLDKHWISERTLADKTKWAKDKGDFFINKFKTLPQKQLMGKFRYVKLLGDKKENNVIATIYNYIPLPYPKRDSK